MTRRFQPLTTQHLDLLREMLGPEAVVLDEETRRIYAQDETEDLLFMPDIVLKPATVASVSQILRFASEHGIPVTPRGGGTGLSGGALPVHGGICLSMERFNRILEIDEKNLVAVAEPGVITQALQEAVEERGLYFPPDPSSRGSSHLGGNLAECAGGPHAVKYGVTKDYVLGLEAVLPTGEIIQTGGRVLKNVTGYNLTQLLIGSEGTLAVITRVTLRLIPAPKARKVMLVAFPTLEDAAAAVSSVFHRGVTPAALEFMERAAVRAAEEKLGKKFPNGEAGAQLLIEIDGPSAELIDREVQEIASAVEGHGASDILLAEDRRQITEVWALRKSIGESVKSISTYKEEDTVVPRSRLPELVRGVKSICARYGITSICYGHAGDGNVHVNILKAHMTDEEWNAGVESAVREIFHLTVSLGGTISGEHGIGYSQKRYLPLALSPVEIALMQRIKEVFDPQGILNPGKIFPG
jgi:glycolate oxidase